MTMEQTVMKMDDLRQYSEILTIPYHGVSETEYVKKVLREKGTSTTKKTNMC